MFFCCGTNPAGLVILLFKSPRYRGFFVLTLQKYIFYSNAANNLHFIFTSLFTPPIRFVTWQKAKWPCRHLQSHYPIPQKIIHQSLHHSPIYMYIAQHYTRKKAQPIIWCREDMQTAKDSTWIDSGQVEKDEERKWLRSEEVDI